jgi:hypothetical protein
VLLLFLLFLFQKINFFLGINNSSDLRWIEQEIQKIMKKFKVSEKLLWYIKIQCYSKKSDWNGLLKLANEKKSPVGYVPFANVAIK